MFCPNCGSKNSPDATFCANCGFRLKLPEVPPTPAVDPARTSNQGPTQMGANVTPNQTTQTAASPTKGSSPQSEQAPSRRRSKKSPKSSKPGHSKKKMWLWLILIILVLAGGLTAGYFVFFGKDHNPPQELSKSTKYNLSWTTKQSDALADYMDELAKNDNHEYSNLPASTLEEIAGNNLGKYFEDTKELVDGDKKVPVRWFVTDHLVDKETLQVLAVYLDRTEEIAYVFGVLEKKPVTYVIEGDGDELKMTEAPKSPTTEAFADIYDGKEAKAPEAEESKSKKTAARWSSGKMTSLSQFMGSWQTKMHQNYVGTYDGKSPDADGIIFPEIIEDGPESYRGKITVNGQDVKLTWSEKADTTDKWQIVAAAVDKHSENGRERMITYLFAFEDGKPVVLVSEDKGTTRNFTPTKNNDLQKNFARIASE